MMEAMMALLAAASATLVALVFTQAAWHKLGDFTAFTGYLADYRLLPEASVPIAAVGLVGAEILVVAGLIGGARGIAAMGAATLLLVYAGGITINLLRGRRHIECGCGGAVQPLSSALVIRNLLLSAAATVVASAPLVTLTGGAAAAGLSVGFLAWVLLGAAEQIMANSGAARRLQ